MTPQFSLPLLAAAIVLPSFFSQSAHAQEQVVETLICQSTPGTRATCPVNGEIISAGIQRQSDQGTPCFLNYTWGFAENGLWTGNGCSAEFVVTVERASARPIVDPEVLRSRLRSTREKLRDARREVVREQESRRLLEAELVDTQEALRAAESGQARQKKKRRPQNAVRSVAVCSSKAIREAKKSGAEKARVAEILMARPTEGAWLVIGRVAAQAYNQRASNFSRCWSEKGKVISYENSL